MIRTCLNIVLWIIQLVTSCFQFFTERCHSRFKLGLLNVQTFLLRPGLGTSSSLPVLPRVCSSKAGSTLSDETSSIPPLPWVCNKRVNPPSSWLRPEALISPSLTYTVKFFVPYHWGLQYKNWNHNQYYALYVYSYIETNGSFVKSCFS